MLIAVQTERVPGERRVAIVPDGVKVLTKLGATVAVAPGAGAAAGFPDAAYEAAGAEIRDAASEADLLLSVQLTDESVEAAREGATVIGLARPLDTPELAAQLAARKLNAFALELMPRITRAQSMDVLSSQATVAGYRASLLAADRLPRMLPMLVTAAGTISPARFFIIGAGVAGLQAIATAKRLGAVVEAYDTRSAAAEQVESLGARFVEVDLDAGDSEDSGGYAKAQSEEFYAKQRELMAECAARADVVITTALVPGREAPLLITDEAVAGMKPGSIVVDLAAANGGNCAPSKADQEVDVGGVKVLGPTNLPSDLPLNASQMFSKNLVTFLQHLAPEGELVMDLEDEITKGALLVYEGEVTNAMVREKLGLAPAPAPSAPEPPASGEAGGDS
ncbi:MAG: Re/Si-specific NAD(P)(+) transhydrogenase subunit alpha [Myxococcota bacterium]|nr:Re/Si-specific NAD(P)(+) transhydrogenase subunit alpha [Myxococcota bacterium]